MLRNGIKLLGCLRGKLIAFEGGVKRESAPPVCVASTPKPMLATKLTLGITVKELFFNCV